MRKETIQDRSDVGNDCWLYSPPMTRGTQESVVEEPL